MTFTHFSSGLQVLQILPPQRSRTPTVTQCNKHSSQGCCKAKVIFCAIGARQQEEQKLRATRRSVDCGHDGAAVGS